MTKNVLTVLLFFVACNCFAQQDYFVLIQADNKQPFYARVNGKIFSSSDNGHLILPQLRDTTHRIAIGFPKNIYPEQNFVIAIKKKDQSFQLKNLGDNRWALFNTKTMELQMALNADTTVPKQIITESAKKEDAFARLMAGVVNDTSIMHHNVIEEDEPIKIATATDSKIADTDNKNDSSKKMVTNKIDQSKTVQKETPNPTPPVLTKPRNPHPDTLNKTFAKTKASLSSPKDTTATNKNLSFIKKINEQKGDTAYHLQFVDIPNNGAIDTIDILIPFGTEPLVVHPKKDTIQNLPKEINNKESKAQKSRDTIRTLIDTSVLVTKKPEENKIKDTTLVTVKSIVETTVNKDCRSFASDYDIDKLRVKMMAIDNDDDKISTARTVFKVKCFSVKQVQALTEIFKTDEGKYRLFDATYMHVSDKGNFVQLQSLLSDQYYINRFKAMIR